MELDFQILWDRCLKTISKNVGEQAYKTWFAPITPLRFQNNILTIQVPSQFFYEWLEEHYVHILQNAIEVNLGEEGKNRTGEH